VGLHASVIGGFNICISFNVKYIDVGGISCLGNRGLSTVVNYVLEFFENKWAS
jgi:hypothetical protein